VFETINKAHTEFDTIECFPDYNMTVRAAEFDM